MLTGRYHWPYVGGWLVFNVVLTLVVEGFVLAALTTIEESYTQLPISSYGLISAVVAIVVIVGLTGLAALWAHRIAGVHIRTESVFNRIADGDRSARLRYRSSDQLEDVEEAFERMMLFLASGRKSEKTRSVDMDDSAEASERRSWRNMQMTSKYHFSYMAVWLLVSVGLLMAAYAACLFYFYLRHYVLPETQFDLTLYSVILSVFVVIVAAVTIWKGFNTAHRLAGVHIKLAQTFDRVASGETGVELRFRSYDRLTHLEDAFRDMLETLQLEEEKEV